MSLSKLAADAVEERLRAAAAAPGLLACERDAARYAWIRSHTRSEADELGIEWGWHTLPGDAFGAAIDAALSTTPGHAGCAPPLTEADVRRIVREEMWRSRLAERIGHE